MKRLHHNGPISTLKNRQRYTTTPPTSPVKIIVSDGNVLNKKRYNDISNPAPLAESLVTASRPTGRQSELPFSDRRSPKPVNNGSMGTDQVSTERTPASRPGSRALVAPTNVSRVRSTKSLKGGRGVVCSKRPPS